MFFLTSSQPVSQPAQQQRQPKPSVTGTICLRHRTIEATCRYVCTAQCERQASVHATVTQPLSYSAQAECTCVCNVKTASERQVDTTASQNLMRAEAGMKHGAVDHEYVYRCTREMGHKRTDTLRPLSLLGSRLPKRQQANYRRILPMAPSAAALRPSEPPGGASVPARQTYSM